ncbi:hypothetical protein HYW17_02910 [Candidatus Uhrbacteria bacterium]|nr:hypothetical protein [Candidatus Uhrbacteria bacterium]
MRQGALLESPAHRPLIRRDCLTATEARELYREDDGLGDGMNCARPCPFVRCRHHLYLDANPNYGSIKLNFPHLELWELKESCALDVADRGGITLEEVGVITNLTRERVRQVEVRGLLKLKQTAAEKLEVEGHGVPAAKADDPDAVWRTPEFRHKAAAWPDQRDRELALLVCAGASVAKAAARVGMGREAVELVLQKIARWGGRTTDKVA